MIEINGIKKIDDKRQLAYFTIDGQKFSCGNIPSDLIEEEDVLAYLNARKDELRLVILINQYPESDHRRFQKEDITEFEAMQKWIAKGHRNKIQIGLTATGKPKYDYQVIEKQELEYKHPKSIRLLALVEASNVAKETKDLLKEIVKI